MRDIRSDLQERATLINEQVRATYAHFERMLQQLHSEQEAKIAELKSGLAMNAKFMEFEERFLPNRPPMFPAPPLVEFADRFMRMRDNSGRLSMLGLGN